MKKVILILVLIFMVPLATANLNIELDKTEVNTTVGFEQNLIANLTNSFGFKIYKINLVNTEGVSMIEIPELSPGFSISQDLIINTEREFNLDSNMNFYFYFNATLDLGPENYSINSYKSYFYPNELNVISGSTVEVCNKESSLSLMEIQKETEGWIGLSYEDCHTYTLTDTETIYNSLGSQIVISVNPPSTSVLVTNPDLNTEKTIKINSTYFPGDLIYEIVPKNITTDYNQVNEMVIYLENVGDTEIYNIHLEGSWCGSFNRNNFNLSEGSSKIVTFLALPTVLTTEETNTTHTKSVTISADNLNDLNATFDVFVNFADINITYEEEELQAMIDDLMARLATYSANLSDSNGSIVYRQPEVTVTYTAEDILEQKRKIEDLIDTDNENERKTSDKLGEISSTMNQLTGMVIDMNTTNNKDREILEGNTTWIYLISSIILILAGTISFIILIKQIKKHRLTEVEVTQ